MGFTASLETMNTTLVQTCADIEHMTAAATPCLLIYGGDEYLNDQITRDTVYEQLAGYPERELVRLDAQTTDQYAFEEAVSPSLLSTTSVVWISHMEHADTKLLDAIVAYADGMNHDPQASPVIMNCAGNPKGHSVETLMRRHNIPVNTVPKLDKAKDKLNYVYGEFDKRHRRIEPQAAQQLVSVLGDSVGELTGMIKQLCFDFDDDPLTINRVNQYLIGNPKVSGFNVADLAMSGKTAQAVIALRSAVEQGVEPIAMIGALALQLRNLAKAAAIRQGDISKHDANINEWALRTANNRLAGWTSQGISNCIQRLAWADEQSKTSGSDPLFALEDAIELISIKGITQ
ncbi:DNA polymerase III subunit delta [Bifidobacterium sp. GSD1FS]|uniref:DNA-directed DNA polymerase n=2 Tax=Bifidobacterium canis TaxID=2610880 RepID=A0A7K1J6Y9_9BIFI|nr:DNA polymerase III subunit delta [Bifidobacterium canis]